MASISEHEPHGAHQSKKAAASGWIGSALEYYDFFIYATAAVPQLFFPSGNPTVAIVASLATYGVGYVARPIGAFVLGHWGDTYGRKNVLILCMLLMGFSTMAVGLLPTYQRVGLLAPVLLVILRLVQGFAVAGEISGELDDSRACAVWSARLLCELHAARRTGRPDHRRGGLPAARRLHAGGSVQCLGLADPVPPQPPRHHRRLHHSPPGSTKLLPLPRKTSWASAPRRRSSRP
jgi:hypothetical protein